ncbi:ubiquitin carboxyl-terminal hydrolase 17 isoform X1 [Olea europaea subsp. europaea]|uniref:ubiquitinyl hydrolase 1 n=1 Tax=Olea europaea subsp. europaea TaxID=158383 RepID=A0A8S0SAP2_OLEEU|nr:ubiquitin carboxyl-terminal hydrolase 17 isoform X1 [Olea europaea subsp. europaea]
MIAIVAILLIFGFVVSQTWKNVAAKKGEILRLVAMASKEDAEIAKLQVVEAYNSPPPFPQVENSVQQVEKRYYCAVCYCPTTTRCSQCKAVRYCSGKCQIIHWRQGHRDECRSPVMMHASKEDGVESASENQFDMHAKDQFKVCSDSTELLNDSGSASTSLPCFSSSTNQSETSFDASISEVLQTGTPISMPSAESISKMPANKSDEGFHSTSFEDKRANDVAASEEFISGATELRNLQHSSYLRTSSSAGHWENEANLSSSKEMRSKPFRGSGDNQISTLEMKRSRRMSFSGGHWKNEARLGNATERRMSFTDSGDYQKISSRTESHHLLPSEVEGARMLSQPARKGLKTSVWDFVQQHFKVPNQSKSYTVGNWKDSRGNNNQKAIFSPQLFTQLYFCDVELHPFGLVNCGNSCYANAVLQCLAFTRPISSYLLQGFHSKTYCKKDWCFICEFEGLILKGQELRCPLSPIRILSQLQKIGSHLSHGREEDAHEFLRYAVDAMQSICLEEAGVTGPLAEDSTLVGLTFGGYLRSKIKCMKCSGRFEQYDRLMDLTVEIDGDIDSLEEALAQFTASETLGGDDKYKCSRCKSYEKAKKQLTVLEAPNILTIVLKRFRSGNLGKLKKLIQFPEVLNLGPFMSGPSDKCPMYSLFAVVVHLDMMNAADSGHYISYIKNFQGDWFRIDDSRVIPVDLETVLSEEAYILLYARHTPRGLSLVRNNSVYSDGKTKRNMEAISSSNSGKKRIPKTKSETLHHWSERHHYPNDFTDNHILDSDGWRLHSMQGNHIMDSLSDSSSIFSISDASSSTDSTKDSSVEDLSDYIFGSSSYRP